MRSRQSGKERTNEINEPNRQRRARREGGEERHIDLLPPAYFEAFRDAATGAVQELWLPGGRYSGKSTFVARCIAALEATQGFEDCHAACFRRHQVDIRESIGTELQLAVDALGVGGLWAVKHSPFRLVRRFTAQLVSTTPTCIRPCQRICPLGRLLSCARLDQDDSRFAYEASRGDCPQVLP